MIVNFHVEKSCTKSFKKLLFVRVNCLATFAEWPGEEDLTQMVAVGT